jgi:hypothetical protein
MSAKDRSRKAVESAWAAQGERYLQRLLQDEDLRDNIKGAYLSARNAYGRVSNGKGASYALLRDAKLQQELIDAANALRSASASLREPPRPKPRRRRRGRRSLLLLVVAGTLAVALSSELRSKVLDLLFGAEEEFDYTSTTTPDTPAPAGVAGS